MSKIIGILSGKGGVGKTTIVANVSTALSYEFNKKVLVLDSNITTSHLGLHFGVYDKPPFTLSDLLDGKVSINEAIYIHPITGVRIIPSSFSMDKKDNLKKLKKIVDQLDGSYEVIIVDCPPGLGKNVISAINSIEEALIVTNPYIPSMTDALKTINVLQKLEKRIIGIVVNRVRGKKYELSMNEIKAMCNAPVISIIPEDLKIPESISKGIPVVLYEENCKSALALKRLAASLIGEVYSSPSFLGKMKNFLGFGKKKKVEREFYPEEKEIKPRGISKKVGEEEVEDVEKLKEELKEEIMKSLKEKLKKRRVE